ncbi:MAG: NirD/YgiW/YdeI family stress tolerance protein, partial [Betaproteobacteria bacterium]|nr:NirD/YgiW/YdeI family stress tolerance protein [Betaproteobacteria bacterium]
AVITVQEASQNQYMDKMVSLRGQITQYTGVDRSIAGANDVYSFTDSTGTIKLVIPAINQDIWMGKYVDSADTVEVSGKLDRVGSGTIILYVRRIVKR